MKGMETNDKGQTKHPFTSAFYTRTNSTPPKPNHFSVLAILFPSHNAFPKNSLTMKRGPLDKPPSPLPPKPTTSQLTYPQVRQHDLPRPQPLAVHVPKKPPMTSSNAVGAHLAQSRSVSDNFASSCMLQRLLEQRTMVRFSPARRQ